MLDRTLEYIEKKHAIFFILDEDKHTKEELEHRRKAEAAISAFSPDKTTVTD